MVAPSTLRIENDQARIVASADLTLRGTFDRPLLFGRAEIERGDVEFEGRRYLVTRGSLDFANARPHPAVLRRRGRDPRARARARPIASPCAWPARPSGCSRSSRRIRRCRRSTSSRCCSATRRRAATWSWRALQRPNEREQRLVEARATRALTGALSAEVGRVVEQTFGVDTFQITPLLNDPYQQSARLNLNPTARVTIGKRISNRIFLTYARSLSSSTRDEIILLEFDESDSLAWVLSQNEDRTYALEVRKRHTF